MKPSRLFIVIVLAFLCNFVPLSLISKSSWHFAPAMFTAGIIYTELVKIADKFLNEGDE